MNFDTDVFFKFLNFAIICIGIVYLVHRYGILYIMSAIRLDRQKKDSEEQKYCDLLWQCDVVKELNSEQELTYVDIKKRFEIWSVKEQQDKKSEQEWFFKYQKELENKQIIKINNMQRQQIIQKQFPEILEEISKEMQEKFEKNHVLKKEYMDKLIASIQERIS